MPRQARIDAPCALHHDIARGIERSNIFRESAHRYLSEYQYRFNRRFDLVGMLSRLITATAQTGKKPEGWLRLAEEQCY